jgi:hypothetical protein
VQDGIPCGELEQADSQDEVLAQAGSQDEVPVPDGSQDEPAASVPDVLRDAG